MPSVTISAGDATATICNHGAHLTAWSVGGKPLIFTSEKAIFDGKKAIRGGVPVCFPQFSDMGPLGQHGFARNLPFTVVDQAADKVTMRLVPGEAQLAAYPHAFELDVTYALGAGGALSCAVRVANKGGDAMKFTFALHSYFEVGALAETSMRGLKGCSYLDNLEARTTKSDGGDALAFPENVDRIYLGVPGDVAICDGARKCRVVLKRSATLPDVVTWNPWAEKAKAMADLGDDEYLRFVCAEA
jgi:glucose-6-phosphate 1-epimerase